MKNCLKKIDKNMCGGYIKRSYQLIYPYLQKYINRKITPLRRGIQKNFVMSEQLLFFKNAQFFLQVNRIDGVYLEFGSHELNTFRMALNTLGQYSQPNNIHKFIAFDSFEGMPVPQGIDKQKIWRKAMNSTSIERFYKIMKRDLHRVEAVKGFYEDTLPKYELNANEKIALAYIDCDYYSSTVSVLSFLKNKLSHGTLLAFDDWDCYYSDPCRGQRLAFSEFTEEVNDQFHFEKFRVIGSGGMSFVCLDKEKMGQAVI
jgi:hypothetical protein